MSVFSKEHRKPKVTNRHVSQLNKRKHLVSDLDAVTRLQLRGWLDVVVANEVEQKILRKLNDLHEKEELEHKTCPR
jgi:hypothetical protein